MTGLDKKIQGPFDLGNGRKYYSVNGTRFEVYNRYNITRSLGYGAYGMVCAATTESGDKVAIKKIPKVFDDLVDGKRILRELKLLAFMKHPNVIALKDVFKALEKATYEDIYFASSLYDTDLHQIIKSKQTLTDDHFQYFMYQTLAGMKYIHSANILHRDLKPGNLLVNSNCEIGVCDFGLARGNDRTATFMEYVVTRWYRAPELLLMSTSYNSAVDIWSLGCIFAELMRRKPMFQGKDYINQLRQICDVLGTPMPYELPEVTAPEAIRFLQSMERKKPRSLSDEFPHATAPAVDLLCRMLCLDSRRRITASDALKHPYFSKLQNSTIVVADAGRHFYWDLDNFELTEPQLREGLWKEMLRYHPDI